jgi:hypothetical protein
LPSLIAHALPADRKLTIVTASIPVAAELSPRSPCTVILLGGRVRGRTLATVDHWVPRMLAEHADGRGTQRVQEGLHRGVGRIHPRRSAGVVAAARVAQLPAARAQRHDHRRRPGGHP